MEAITHFLPKDSKTDMTGELFFLTIASVGMSLTGFVTIVAVFLSHSEKREWLPQDVAGLQLMVEHSLAAVLFGLLPSATSLLIHNEHILWRSVSAALALMFLFELLIQINRVKICSERGAAPRRFKTLLFVWFPMSFVVAVIQIFNFTIWATAFAYAIGILWLLLAAGIQFLHFTSYFGMAVDRHGQG